MNKSLLKILAIFLTVGLNWTGLSVVLETIAYYNDTESASGQHTAGALDFILVSTEWITSDDAIDLDAGESVSRSVTIMDDFAGGSVDFKYVARAEKTSGDEDFCSALKLEAYLDAAPVYSGALFDFVSASTTYATSTGEWTFIVSLPGGAPEFGEKECSFNFVYNGWQSEFAGPEDGFYDEEFAPNTLASQARQCSLVNFDTDASEEVILAGQIIDDEYSPWGLVISADNNNSRHPDFAIAFDSSAPTGGDPDLGTPNEDFGGPGIGTGGEAGEPGENNTAQYNILIIAEDDIDGNNDDLVDDPDDEAAGGKLIFTFDAETWVKSLRIFDIEESGVKIKLYDDSNVNFSTIDVSTLGDNSAETINIDMKGVKKMKVIMIHSGAVDDICFEKIESEPEPPTIVLNEFLPNPIGDDNESMPDGEWVELYNLSASAIDVAGWYLYDSLDSHPLPISSANSDNDGDTGDAGETIVPSLGYLLVYLNGAYSSGWLNNGSGGDTVRLYDGPVATGTLIDSYTYVGSSPENKSYARIPDGTGAWVDPIPTPLAPNTLEANQSLNESPAPLNNPLDQPLENPIENPPADNAAPTPTSTPEIIQEPELSNNATTTNEEILVGVASTTDNEIAADNATTTVEEIIIENATTTGEMINEEKPDSLSELLDTIIDIIDGQLNANTTTTEEEIIADDVGVEEEIIEEEIIIDEPEENSAPEQEPPTEEPPTDLSSDLSADSSAEALAEEGEPPAVENEDIEIVEEPIE